MPREIKFRGKRIDNGEWVYGYLFTTPLTNETGIADHFLSGQEKKYQICDEHGVVFEIDIKTVGQFIGREDKNGKEIYEKDIVKFIYNKDRFRGVLSYGQRLDKPLVVNLVVLNMICFNPHVDFEIEIIGDITNKI